MDFESFFEQNKVGNELESNATPSPLKSLKVDLDFYSDSIKEVSTEIIAEGFSLFPIFVAHQHQVSVGETILDKNELGTNWSINASSLEEFIEKGVIKQELKNRFEKSYKNAEKYMCLFVVVPEGANFVYYPYKT